MVLGLAAPAPSGVLLAVSVGSPVLPLAWGSVCGLTLWLRTLLLRVRSQVFAARSHVLHPQSGGVSGNAGRFGSLGKTILGSWRS